VGDAVSAPRNLSRPDDGWNHRIAAVNGVDIHYVREGQGRPLILLHGWPEFWWAWSRNIPALARNFDVIAPDFRGFGDTRETATAPAGPETHAKDILALADSLGLGRFGIVAHDVGASVSQQIARVEPARLNGLFLNNAPYPGIGRRWVDPGQVKEIWYQSFNQQPYAAALVGHSRATCRMYLEHVAFNLNHSLRR
jgi:pimeloyl-ACP methyl ester carboxylesterase